MVILAFYGFIAISWSGCITEQEERDAARAPQRFSELPFVTVQLPIFNEQFVIDRLIDACCRLDYPRDRFEIQVLDDSTDETQEVAAEIVERYRSGLHGEPQPIVYCTGPIGMDTRRARWIKG